MEYYKGQKIYYVDPEKSDIIVMKVKDIKKNRVYLDTYEDFSFEEMKQYFFWQGQELFSINEYGELITDTIVGVEGESLIVRSSDGLEEIFTPSNLEETFFLEKKEAQKELKELKNRISIKILISEKEIKEIRNFIHTVHNEILYEILDRIIETLDN